MQMKMFYVPTETKGDMNYLQVSVDHYKNTKTVNMFVCPCQVKSDGRVISLPFDGKHHRLEPMERLSRKRLDVIHAAVKTAIDTKTGPYWDFITSYAKEKGYTIQ